MILLNRRRLYAILLLLAGSVSLATWAQSRLTEAAVRDTLQAMQQAVEDQDVAALLSHFSENPSISFDLGADRGGSVDYDLRFYRLMLEETWDLVANFSYQVRDQSISIAPDGQSAEVKQLVRERIDIDGRVVTDVLTQEHLRFELGASGLKIVGLDAKLTDQRE